MRLLPLITVLLFAALAGPASADLTLTNDASGVTVTGTSAADVVAITGDGSSITFTVPTGTISTSDCPGGGTTSVTCTGVAAATVKLAAGKDVVRSPSPLTTSFLVAVIAGAGVDTLNLSDRTDGVTADPAHVEGSAFALKGVEGIVGTPKDDTLFGDDLANRLRGENGSDRLQGGLGDDQLEGGGGADTLRDAGGNDTFNAGSGYDVLFARDEVAENVDCGLGQDTAEIDGLDTPKSCETITGSPAPAYVIPTPTPAPQAVAFTPPPAAGKLVVRRKRARLRKRTIIRVGTATCTASTRCRLRVRTRLGTRRRRVAAGRKVAIRFKVSRKAARRLRHRAKRRIVFRVRLAATGTTTVRKHRKVIVRT